MTPHFKFRWPERERKAAAAKAKQDGFASLSAYIRHCIEHCKSVRFARNEKEIVAKEAAKGVKNSELRAVAEEIVLRHLQRGRKKGKAK